jgi:hypothetical protein
MPSGNPCLQIRTSLDSPADKPHIYNIVQHSLAGLGQRFFIALAVTGGIGFVATFGWMWLFSDK